MIELDEAIKHCHEKAKELRETAVKDFYDNKTTLGEMADCRECANEHEQLAEWLTELKERREADRWIPVTERLPDEKINPNTQDFEEVLCTTVWGDVRVYKFGKPYGHDKAHFWSYGEIMDEFIVKWRLLPKASESEAVRNDTRQIK